PEIMAPSCQGLLGGGGSLDFSSFLVFAQPLQMKFLIEDPDGGGRDISYELRTCASTDDLLCSAADGGSKALMTGITHAGELDVTEALGTEFLSGSIFDGGSSLLLATVAADTYHGLGGIRVPVVLHLKAGEEEIFAQKLMVYSCKLFDDQTANVTPILPGI